MFPAISLFEVLLCFLFVFLRNGAIGGQGCPYTEEEERVIIEEVEKYPYDTIPIFGMKLWQKIANKLSEKRKLNPSAFPRDRTPGALNVHFKRQMLKSKSKIPVPESLLRRLPIKHQTEESFVPENEQSNFALGKNKGKKRGRFSDEYTVDEEKFLIEEVVNYPDRPVPIYGVKMWMNVADHFKTKHDEDPVRFPYERTPKGLKQRFRIIINSKIESEERDHLIKEIRRWAPRETENTMMARFNKAEDDFIVEEILQLSCANMFSYELWNDMKKKHDQKRLLETPGFTYERTGLSLFIHFFHAMTKEYSTQLALSQKFPQEFFAQQAASQSAFQFQPQCADLQEIDEHDTEAWDCMIDELQNNAVEVDFNRVLSIQSGASSLTVSSQLL